MKIWIGWFYKFIWYIYSDILIFDPPSPRFKNYRAMFAKLIWETPLQEMDMLYLCLHLIMINPWQMETLSLYGKMIESPLVCITIHVTYVTYSLMVFIRDGFEKNIRLNFFRLALTDYLLFIFCYQIFTNRKRYTPRSEGKINKKRVLK